MKLISKGLFLLIFFVIGFSFCNAQEENIVVNEGGITIYAKSKNVWKVLTDTKKYAKVMGYDWKSGKKNIEAVGDHAEMDILEQQTAYEVTFLEPGQQLSVKIIPSNAEYVNEKTWILIPVDKWTTKVKVKDVYTLPSSGVPPSASEQINNLQNRLEKLRSLAERSY